MEKKLASIEFLPGQQWSAQAALGDAMAKVNEKSKVIILFLDDNNALRTRSANVSYSEAHLMLCHHIQLLINEMVVAGTVL